MTGNSTYSPEHRELPSGARQRKESMELALELLPEIEKRYESRRRRKPGVTGAGYKMKIRIR